MALVLEKEKVEVSQQRLSLAAKAAKLGIWDWDIEQDILEWDDQMFALFGQNKDSVENRFKLWENTLHPDDKEKALKDVNDALIGGKEFDTSFRIIHPNGRVLHIKGNALVLRDVNGKAKRMLGINSDITEAKMKEIEIRTAKEKAERIAQELEESQKAANLGSWYLDIATNKVIWSEELYKMYGLDSSLPPPPYTEHMKLFTEESWNTLSAEILKTQEKGLPYELELETIRKDKSNGWMWVKGEAVFDDMKNIVGIRGITQDISLRKENEDRLKKTVEAKDRLFKELHHRIKNNLHMVSSLMYSKSLLSKDEDLNDFIKETIGRVNSIAKIHDTLLHLEELDILYTKEYLEDLVTSVVKSLALNAENYPLELDIENYKMDVDSVMALGLITNESISNIIKHAYDPNTGGKIMVSYKKNGDDYTLIIRDNGKGMRLNDDDKFKSVGLMIIDQLAKQLQGEIERKVENGTYFKLNFPEYS